MSFTNHSARVASKAISYGDPVGVKDAPLKPALDARMMDSRGVWEQLGAAFASVDPAFQSSSIPDRVEALARHRDSLDIRRKVPVFFTVVGIVAALIVLPAVVYQIVTIILNQSACDISYVYLGGLFLTNYLWLVYYFANRTFSASITAAAGSLVAAAIIGLKARYDSDGHCPATQGLI